MLPNVDSPVDEPRLKLYVLVNTEILTPIQIGVQASHALTELVHRYAYLRAVEKWVTEDKTLIFLSANEVDKDEKIQEMLKLGKMYASFKEPDIGNIWTATAFEPLDSKAGKAMFGNLKLAR